MRSALFPQACLLWGDGSRWDWTGSSVKCECWNQVFVLNELWNTVFMAFYLAFNSLWLKAFDNTQLWLMRRLSHPLNTTLKWKWWGNERVYTIFLKLYSQSLFHPFRPLAPSFPSQIKLLLLLKFACCYLLSPLDFFAARQLEELFYISNVSRISKIGNYSQ